MDPLPCQTGLDPSCPAPVVMAKEGAKIYTFAERSRKSMQVIE